MIKAVLIEDEKLAREVIRDYLKSVPFIELKDEFRSPMDAIEALQEKRYDLLFLDIQMPGLNGLQLLESLPYSPAVIITTAYESHALKGYEFNTIDYLLKPIAFDRFLKACIKAKEQFTDATQKTQTAVTTDETLVLKDGPRIYRLDPQSIHYLNSDRDYTTFHHDEGKITLLASLRSMQERLNPNRFMRIHKSYIVNLSKVSIIETSRVQIGGEWLPVGRSYRSAVSKAFDASGNN